MSEIKDLTEDERAALARMRERMETCWQKPLACVRPQDIELVLAAVTRLGAKADVLDDMASAAHQHKQTFERFSYVLDRPDPFTGQARLKPVQKVADVVPGEFLVSKVRLFLVGWVDGCYPVIMVGHTGDDPQTVYTEFVDVPLANAPVWLREPLLVPHDDQEATIDQALQAVVANESCPGCGGTTCPTRGHHRQCLFGKRSG